MSKFDYDLFICDEIYLAVNKERYTEQQAVEIAKRELHVENVKMLDGYVYYGFGIIDDEEKYNGWWLTFEKPKRGCSVWAFFAVEEV